MYNTMINIAHTYCNLRYWNVYNNIYVSSAVITCIKSWYKTNALKETSVYSTLINQGKHISMIASAILYTLSVKYFINHQAVCRLVESNSNRFQRSSIFQLSFPMVGAQQSEQFPCRTMIKKRVGLSSLPEVSDVSKGLARFYRRSLV